MYLSIHFIVAEGPLGFVNFPISLQDAAAAAQCGPAGEQSQFAHGV